MERDRPVLALECAVLCDEIRREDNGKLLLIGVYSGDIAVSSFPAPLALSVYITARAVDRLESSSVRLLVSGSSKRDPVEVAVPQISGFAVEADATFVVAIGRLHILVSEPGQVSVQLKAGARSWEEILKRKIVSTERS